MTATNGSHQRSGKPRRRFLRSGEGLEFERVAFFTDAVFAIAMTLLIVAVDIPGVTTDTDSREMWEAVVGLGPSLFAFFLGFFVLGSYWLAHHRGFGRLGAVDARYTFLNLIYLAFVAFLPFPTGLLGEHNPNAVTVTVFALAAAAVSLMEAICFHDAWKRGLMREEMPAPVFWWGFRLSLLPVAVFLASIPIAFWNPTVALLSWASSIPLEAMARRRKPADADAFYD